MAFLKHMKLGTLLGLGFSAVILIGLLVAGYGGLTFNSVDDDIQELSEERIRNLLLLETGKDSINTAVIAVRNMVFMDGRQDISTETQRLDQAMQQVAQVSTQMRQFVRSAESRALLAQMEQRFAPFQASMTQARQLAINDDDDAATALILGPLRDTQLAYFTAFDDMIAFQRRAVEQLATSSSQNVQTARNTMLVLALLAALFGGLIAWAITRHVKRQLGGEPAYAVEVAQAVAEGNLSVAVRLQPGDTTSVLAAMGTMRANLARIVSEVRQGSEAIATGASQIASGNTDLSSRTEEQAASLEQTAASMEEMASTVQQNADTVRAASQLAGTASSTAAQGGEVVNQVVNTMQDITTSSRRIGDIIGVIDSIAFQTNILALNAAVEAARAGEQGRGFAVVASEVRTLAQRSAQAAKEIKALIEESVGMVELGSQRVTEAGATVSAIVDQARRVADLIGEIGSATEEQTQGISQVSTAVNQLDQVTQQNAALVEESAAAADSLSSQAERLVQLVSVFQLDEHANVILAQAPRAASVRPAPRPKAAPRPTVAAAAPRQVRHEPVVTEPAADTDTPPKAPKAPIAPKASSPALRRPTLSAKGAAPAASKNDDDDWETF